jgi:hypothetical protein
VGVESQPSKVTHLRKILIAAVALATLTRSHIAGANEVKADKDRIRAHMHFLADDLLEGREAGTRRFEIAARYVGGQFAQIGILPT